MSIFFKTLRVYSRESDDFLSCSRNCLGCANASSEEVFIFQDSDEIFFTKAGVFLSKNDIQYDSLILARYGDLVDNFENLQKVIGSMEKHSFFNANVRCVFWLKIENRIPLKILDYIGYGFSYKFPVINISVSLTDSEYLNKIDDFLLYLDELQEDLGERNVQIKLQLNNIKYAHLDLESRKIIFEKLQNIQKYSCISGIGISDYEVVNANLDFFSPQFLEYIPAKQCPYLKDLLLKNTGDNMYFSNLEIAANKLSLHNRYCNKLQHNYFGTLDSSVLEIRENLKKFIRALLVSQKVYDRLASKDPDICTFCIKHFDNIYQPES